MSASYVLSGISLSIHCRPACDPPISVGISSHRPVFGGCLFQYNALIVKNSIRFCENHATKSKSDSGEMTECRFGNPNNRWVSRRHGEASKCHSDLDGSAEGRLHRRRCACCENAEYRSDRKNRGSVFKVHHAASDVPACARVDPDRKTALFPRRS